MKTRFVYSEEFLRYAEIYRKAKNKNDSAAQFELAKLYGASRDPTYNTKAFELYKAIANGKKYSPECTDACFEIGMCYEIGRGTKRSYAQAIRWYKRAEAHITQDLSNNPDPIGEASAAKLRYFSETGLLDQMLADPSTEMIECMIESAENGNSESQKFLMETYGYGRGVAADGERAVYWAEKAAEQGNADAQNFLGHSYYYGDGVAKDVKRAIYWSVRAAEQGCEASIYRLGEYYASQGQYKQAAPWYQLYAEHRIRWRNQRLGWETPKNKQKER